ncbi:AAA family ATPase [Campylobacter corcagiensis]|uniref:ATP-binding protein n=1 Tax=Campylobacter corcagiensis TaxID=1448857 RepID=A0A7M1LEB2_9BACT|nr:AAA family ATPase [Campylobacter corcagiensis]QKF64917.1 ATP-binding protein (AAA domain) [Campylobacter corcagiensis]QOQ86922.1 ATP-binding protein [Campylobacter corcagiensis]
MKYYDDMMKIIELRVAVYPEQIALLIKNRPTALYKYLGENAIINNLEIPNILKKLKETLRNLEANFKVDNQNVLEKNLNFLEKTLNLTHTQKQILKISTLILSLDSAILNSVSSNFKFKHDIFTLYSKILKISTEEIEKTFEAKTVLDYVFSIDLSSRHKFLEDNDFAKYLFLEDGINKFIENYTYKLPKTSLNFSDYSHIKKHLDILLPYLKHSIKHQTKGVNILFYGKPGVGKSEICSLIAKECDAFGLGILASDKSEYILRPLARVANLNFMANFVSKNTIFVYDEAEDIFNLNEKSKQDFKAYFNNILENNKKIVIYITNYIDCIDEAILRRFDMIVEFSDIPKKQKRKIIDKYAKNLVNNKTKNLFSNSKNLQPAVISRALKVIKTLNLKDSSKEFKALLNSSLNAFGYEKMQFKKTQKYLPKNYEISLLNADYDLENLANNIQNSARICLYGVSGGGKSAYARYLADKLKKELMIVSAGDFLSKYVGESERNIKNIFNVANDKKAVLLIDEIEGFIYDKSRALRSWELTMINEFLTSMESFNGILVATSNRIDLIDKAFLRRFDLMIELKSLNFTQTKELFKKSFESLGLSSEVENLLLNLRNLTVGDFEAIKRSMKFLKINSDLELFEILKERNLLKENL